MTDRPILCVDDEPINLSLLRSVLQDEFRLVFARSGPDAIEAVRRHRPALILLDVLMPGMTGFEVARRLKANPETEGIPIIFVTGLTEAVDEQAGFDAGGVDYIAKPIVPSIVQARVRAHLSLIRTTALEKSQRAAIHMLAEAGHYNDTDTGMHIWRMGGYTRLLALAAGWDEEQAGLIELAAPMHDTGKLGIPDAILKKPGQLNTGEWEVMRTHPRIGYEILSKSDAPVFQLAAEIALRHHERWDGSGYPDGLAGESIPESARIVAVTDVFDALTVRRPYKEAWPLDRTLATLEQAAGRHLDARLVEIFTDILAQVLEVKAHWDAEEAARKATA